MTILRRAEYSALRNIPLSGAVVDLGGEKRSEYHALFKGRFTVTTANLGGTDAPDVVLDLEKPLPFADASYDGALLINVLEHIFEYRQLLTETARILKPGGKAVIVVPFLFPVHPSPEDYHRYTAAALEKALVVSGFSDVCVFALGTGVCAARFVLLERLFPPISFLTPFVYVLDGALASLARMLGKKYRPSDYPLGYVVTAAKKA